MPSKTTWLLIAGGAVAVIVVAAMAGKKESKKEEPEPPPDLDPSLIAQIKKGPGGFMPPEELAGVWGPGPWSSGQRDLVRRYMQQTDVRTALMDVFPGLKYLHSWLKKRKVPMTLDVGIGGVRENLQYGPPESKISPDWETDLDSAMLKGGMAIRLFPSVTNTYEPRLGPPKESGAFRIYQDSVNGKMYAWNAFTGEYEPLPVAEVDKGVVKISANGSQQVRDALAERYPSGMSYGDSDRILYVLSTFDGRNRKALKVGPQNEVGRSRLSSSFPAMDPSVDSDAILGAEGGVPVAGLLEDPDAWLEAKEEEILDAGADYLEDKANDVLSSAGKSIGGALGF